jgi:hypothetical protein
MGPRSPEKYRLIYSLFKCGAINVLSKLLRIPCNISQPIEKKNMDY